MSRTAVRVTMARYTVTAALVPAESGLLTSNSLIALADTHCNASSILPEIGRLQTCAGRSAQEGDSDVNAKTWHPAGLVPTVTRGGSRYETR